MSKLSPIPSFVRIILRDERGRLLCLKDLGGRWQLPGGKIENDESPMEAAARELLEETKVILRAGSIVETARLTFSGAEWDGFLVAARDYVGLPQIGEPEKFSEIGFHTLNFISRDQTPEFNKILDRTLGLLGP